MLKKYLDQETLIRLHQDLCLFIKHPDEIELLAKHAVANSLILSGQIKVLRKNSFWRKEPYVLSVLNLIDLDKFKKGLNTEERVDLIIFALSYLRAQDQSPYQNLNPEEASFVLLIDQVEALLQDTFWDYFEPFLTQKEKEILLAVKDILNSQEGERKKIALITDLLSNYEKQLVSDLNSKIEELFIELEKYYDNSRNTFGWQEIPISVRQREKERAAWGYNSNITAFFFNDLRRLKEMSVDNLLANRRANQWAFNRNIYKLSVLSHLRGWFRALIYQGSKDLTTKYKLFVPSFVLPTLKKDSVTKKYLLAVKTLKEWKNITVLDGLGLHHNSQEYYFPILD